MPIEVKVWDVQIQAGLTTNWEEYAMQTGKKRERERERERERKRKVRDKKNTLCFGFKVNAL